jgi:heme-degrading monooxygenase HmoA
MAYARTTCWEFKPGKREEAMKKAEAFMDEIRNAHGFRGFMSLPSQDNPNQAIYVVMWESEADLKAGRERLQRITNSVSDYIARPPKTVEQAVSKAEFPQIYA